MGNALELEGFIQLKQKFDDLFTDNPKMAAVIRKRIRYVLADARNAVAQSVQTNVPYDPHQAFRAVRRTVYKQIFGGSINILNNRHAGALTPIPVVHKLDLNPHQRGGNRMRPSARTIALQSYQGKDRGFILRFLNSGTPGRSNNGIRDVGAIEARNFFYGIATSQIEKAAETLSELIDQEIEKIFNDR